MIFMLCFIQSVNICHDVDTSISFTCQYNPNHEEILGIHFKYLNDNEGIYLFLTTKWRLVFTVDILKKSSSASAVLRYVYQYMIDVNSTNLNKHPVEGGDDKSKTHDTVGGISSG